MKGRKGLGLFLLVLSIISGYLMSKASLVGRVGMSLFYREYNFLKVWWKGSLLVLVSLVALYLLQSYLQKNSSLKQGKNYQLIACLLALVGLYFTYYDFRHTLSHHLLGERFHIGAYLFWLGWITVSLFLLLNKKEETFQLPVEKDKGDYKPAD